MFNQKLTTKRSLILMTVLLVSIFSVLEYLFFPKTPEVTAKEFIIAYKNRNIDLAGQYVHPSFNERLRMMAFSSRAKEQSVRDEIADIQGLSVPESRDGDDDLESGIGQWTNGSTARLGDDLNVECTGTDERQRCVICCDVENNDYIVHLEKLRTEWKVVIQKEDR